MRNSTARGRQEPACGTQGAMGRQWQREGQRRAAEAAVSISWATRMGELASSVMQSADQRHCRYGLGLVGQPASCCPFRRPSRDYPTI